MRVVIDTNVVISATFWPGKSKRLLNAVRRREITYITPERLLEELRAVLANPDKPFTLSPEEAGTVVNAMRAIATIVSPTCRISVCRDEDDNRVLECALEGKADYIVTGDKDLLDHKVFEGIKIVPVSDLLPL